MAQRIEIYPCRTVQKKKYRWRCVATNGQIVATGHQSFANKSNAFRAATTAIITMRSIKGDFVDVEKEDS